VPAETPDKVPEAEYFPVAETTQYMPKSEGAKVPTPPRDR
jgi:hypothetical protein